ncbi:MAG: response regulator transcription factor [Anaerovoracaceae bacterium]|jgi:two-component system copper resistance phosphate regulon response regulator CusR
MRILVVEDEPKLNQIIVERLKKEHYSVDGAMDGNEAMDYLCCAEYDAVVLDIMLPGQSGIRVLRNLREKGDKTPVLLLTARDKVEDRVEGLDAGADDYLVKPFAFEELLARVRVLIRRGAGGVTNVFTLADLTVDCDARTARRGEMAIPLATKEFDILEYMIRNRGKVLPKERIIKHVWNYDYEGSSNVIEVYMRYLRKKLDDDFSPKLIHTVRGAGYVLRIPETEEEG